MKVLLIINSVAIAINVIAFVLSPNYITVLALMFVTGTWFWCFHIYQKERSLIQKFEEFRMSFPINDKTCKYYCQVNFCGVCAVNPKGSCQGCKDYEPRVSQ